MRDPSFRWLLPLILVAVAASACVDSGDPSPTPRAVPAVVRVAVEPPLLAADGKLRFVTTPENWIQAEDVATGTVLWTLPSRIPAAAPSLRWRLLLSEDGSSLYVQSLSDQRGLTYQGTRRVEPRTGAELANDIKLEIYWYENVVLWTALGRDGRLRMAVQRPTAAGGGYRLRTLDPLTLKLLTDEEHATPPSILRH